MKLASLISVIAALTLSSAASAQSSKAQTVEFNWRGETFVLTIPQDYCVPEGRWAEQAKTNAASDSQNETVVDLERCGTFGQAYILIKTPYEMPPIDMPRRDFVNLVAEQFNTEVLEEGIRGGSDDISRSSNGELSVEQRDYAFAGTDDYCVYLSGSMALNGPEGSLDVRVGSCVTLVGTRNFAVHVYDNREGGADAATLQRRSREVAQTIRRK